MRSLLLSIISTGIVMLASGSAAAQSLSGRGVLSDSQAEVACISEITRLAILVEILDEQRDAMIKCNDKDMVFAGKESEVGDGDGCVEFKPNVASWDSTTDPSQLTFKQPDGSTLASAKVDVLRGKPGPRGICPASHPREVTP